MNAPGWPFVFVHALDVLVVLVPAVLAWQIKKAMRLPSGEPIGRAMEETHAIAHTNHAQLVQHGAARERDGEALERALSEIGELKAELRAARAERG